MGVGDEYVPALASSREDLLKHALTLDLGFSECQVLHAIDDLVEVYGCTKDAYHWIAKDNFTLLVDYILDNSEMLQAHVPAMESINAPLMDGGMKLQKERLSKKTLNDVMEKRVESVDVSGVDGRRKPKVSLQRKAMRSHFREKIPSSLKAQQTYSLINSKALDAQVDEKRMRIDNRIIRLDSEERMSMLNAEILNGVEDLKDSKVSENATLSPQFLPHHVLDRTAVMSSGCTDVIVNKIECIDSRDDMLNKSLLDQLERYLVEEECDKALEVLSTLFGVINAEASVHKGKKVLLEEGSNDSRLLLDYPIKNRGWIVSYDVSRGLEKIPITCVNEYNLDNLPYDFLYITRSVITKEAHVDMSFSRIGDLHCNCSGDCLKSSEACRCTDSTRGEYAYDELGCLIPRLATSFQCQYGTQNGDFITECWAKCYCGKQCGNRVVQRGITKKLQVFMTPSEKGWGVRPLEKIPAHSFVFEYLGEIVTNLEQYHRNIEYEKRGVHTYSMNLDADLDMEQKHFKEGLTDTEALVLDATKFGNVSRFVNHRCEDANLFIRPVQIETRDTHYYHAAFFAVRDIDEMEELTWDYGIDFDDDTHSVKAFKCDCKSQLCRDKLRK